MIDFEVAVQATANAVWSDPQGVSLRAGEMSFTRLIRENTNTPDDFLRAPPVQLAFWLIDNWWRLRYEPVVSGNVTPEWRLAHELSAIGGGYIWPRLRIWGEGVRVGLSSRSDPPGVRAPVRYITDALVFVAADQFESAVDRFLQEAIEARSEDHEALQSQFEALWQEREDEQVSAWRRLEAQLGFDPDDAPDQLIETLNTYIADYSLSGVEEAVIAAQGNAAARTLKEEIAAAKQTRLTCDLQEAVRAAGRVDKGPETPPWEAAETVAARVRRALTDHTGPLKNRRLAELLGVSKDVFRARETATTRLSYGLRLRNGERETNVVALRARWTHDRRFELCRALGDAIWSESDALGPLTNAKTARQKFQRAFAQSLLCPFEDLRAYMDTNDPTEDDVSAAAHHFHVSERVVQTVLVNKRIIERQQFEEMVEVA